MSQEEEDAFFSDMNLSQPPEQSPKPRSKSTSSSSSSQKTKKNSDSSTTSSSTSQKAKKAGATKKASKESAGKKPAVEEESSQPSKKPKPFDMEKVTFKRASIHNIKKGSFTSLSKPEAVHLLNWLQHKDKDIGSVKKSNSISEIAVVLEKYSKDIKGIVKDLQVLVVAKEAEQVNLERDSCSAKPADEGDFVALFYIEKKKQEFVGKGKVTKLTADNINVKIVELETEFENEFELGNVFSWNPDEACLWDIYQNDRLSITDFQRKVKVAQVSDAERKVEEMMKELKELKSDKIRLLEKIKKLKSKATEQSKSHSEDLSELYQTVCNHLIKANASIALSTKTLEALIKQKVLKFQNEKIILSSEDLKELGKQQPGPALTHFCKLLKRNNLLQDGGELLLMPGNNSKDGKKITSEFRAKLVACAEVICPQFSKVKIEQHLGAALKEVTGNKEGNEKKKPATKRKTSSADSNPSKKKKKQPVVDLEEDSDVEMEQQDGDNSSDKESSGEEHNEEEDSQN